MKKEFSLREDGILFLSNKKHKTPFNPHSLTTKHYVFAKNKDAGLEKTFVFVNEQAPTVVFDHETGKLFEAETVRTEMVDLRGTVRVGTIETPEKGITIEGREVGFGRSRNGMPIIDLDRDTHKLIRVTAGPGSDFTSHWLQSPFPELGAPEFRQLSATKGNGWRTLYLVFKK